MRERSQPVPNPEDLLERARLTFQNLFLTVLVSAFGLITTTWLLARHYHDKTLWQITAVTIMVSGLRLAVVAAFGRASRSSLRLEQAGRWLMGYGALTLLYCMSLAFSTFYNFRVHDGTAQSLCMVGTLIICSGLSARFGLHPRVLKVAGSILLGTLDYAVYQAPDRLMAQAGCLTITLFLFAYCAAVQNKYDLVMEQIRLRRQMRDLADHDVLTGLANRRRFLDRVATACTQTDAFAILYIDLDKFKKVNDTHGHPMGDALLQHVSARLRRTLREPDLLARLGGDEFAILHAPPADRTTAEELALRITETIAAPFAIDGKELSIGASVGIQYAEREMDPKRLLRQADEALYTAKLDGGSTFRFGKATTRPRVQQSMVS